MRVCVHVVLMHILFSACLSVLARPTITPHNTQLHLITAVPHHCCATAADAAAAGWVGVPHTALYSASKHALRGFFNALRVELSLYQHSPVGVTVCTIGATDTEGTHGIQARISGVTWEHPRVVAAAIVASGAARDRELFFPWLLTLPTIVLHFFAPSLVEKLLHMTMH